MKKNNLYEFLKAFHNPYASMLLVCLLCTDVVFIGLSAIGILTPHFNSYLFSILIDESYPEVFQSIKWFWIVIMLIWLSKRLKSTGFLLMGFVFFYVLIDDTFSFHERMGVFFATHMNFSPAFSFEPHDYGEFLASICSGIIAGVIVLITFLIGNKSFRRTAADIMFLFLVLVFFGVFVDVFKHFFNLGSMIGLILSFIEDSGEMVTGSIIVWYIFLISGQDLNNQVSLIDFLRSILGMHVNKGSIRGQKNLGSCI